MSLSFDLAPLVLLEHDFLGLGQHLAPFIIHLKEALGSKWVA